MCASLFLHIIREFMSVIITNTCVGGGCACVRLERCRTELFANTILL